MFDIGSVLNEACSMYYVKAPSSLGLALTQFNSKLLLISISKIELIAGGADFSFLGSS